MSKTAFGGAKIRLVENYCVFQVKKKQIGKIRTFSQSQKAPQASEDRK
jgi:hypothetical protein